MVLTVTRPKWRVLIFKIECKTLTFLKYSYKEHQPCYVKRVYLAFHRLMNTANTRETKRSQIAFTPTDPRGRGATWKMSRHPDRMINITRIRNAS